VLDILMPLLVADAKAKHDNAALDQQARSWLLDALL
jgi:hypothetical protein